MKAITEKDCKIVSNALGQDTRCCYQDFEIEKEDTYRQKDNYLGQGRRSHPVKEGDIITVMTDGTGWTCWTFKQKAGVKCQN